MSRVGKKPVKLPEGVKAEIKDLSVVVEGPKGSIVVNLPELISAKLEDGSLLFEKKGESKVINSLHGTIQRVVSNAVMGVSRGWEKSLEIVGTGYRSKVEGKTLILTVGYSHPVKFEPPEGITFTVAENIVKVEGIDRRLVGQVAANIRRVRKPDPYKGKGMKYVGERIRRKAGKTAKTGAA